MISPGLVKVEPQVLAIDGFNSFCMLGDPGCDGLGAAVMQIFAAAITRSSGSSLALINGDLVPTGEEKFYRDVAVLVNSLATVPVFSLRGNHDTGDYALVCGRAEYVLLGKEIALIALDNSKRKFTDESLDFLREMLEKHPRKNTVIAFHIPVPNRYNGNTVSAEEFARFQAAIAPYRDRIQYLICGHVHSRFVDEIDGMTLVVSGGAGANIEDVSSSIPASEVNHHIVRFALDENGILKHRFLELADSPYLGELEDERLKRQLETGLEGELAAHLRYQLFAERARLRGFPEIGNLFTSLAESEYRHAMNYYSLLHPKKEFKSAMNEFLNGERYEFNHLYHWFESYADEHGRPLARYAFHDARLAEEVHGRLIENAFDALNQNRDIEKQEYSVCPRCGFLSVKKDSPPSPHRCPVCGTMLSIRQTAK